MLFYYFFLTLVVMSEPWRTGFGGPPHAFPLPSAAQSPLSPVLLIASSAVEPRPYRVAPARLDIDLDLALGPAGAPRLGSLPARLELGLPHPRAGDSPAARSARAPVSFPQAATPAAPTLCCVGGGCRHSCRAAGRPGAARSDARRAPQRPRQRASAATVSVSGTCHGGHPGPLPGE